MLARSTQTIVNQVAALKSMVDAFSQYARTPEPSMRELDLNALTREVLTLYESSLGRSVRLELAPELPRIVGDAAQLRQVIHNLLQNAQDALADTERPRVTIATGGGGRLGRAHRDRQRHAAFPEHMMQRVFEPYVTTKPKGTGLGLVDREEDRRGARRRGARRQRGARRRARDAALPGGRGANARAAPSRRRRAGRSV